MTEDVMYDEAGVATRSVKLVTASTGVTYFLEPKYGNMRGIVARRTDGVRLKCPDSLEGAFTDPRNATNAVENYLGQRGKAKPELRPAPVMDFPVATTALDVATAQAAVIQDEPVQEDDLTVDPEQDAGVVNASEGKDDPEGETVTQRAMRERLAGLPVTTEPDAVLQEPDPAPKVQKRTPRKQA